jgi:hypothetical protein
MGIAHQLANIYHNAGVETFMYDANTGLPGTADPIAAEVVADPVAGPVNARELTVQAAEGVQADPALRATIRRPLGNYRGGAPLSIETMPRAGLSASLPDQFTTMAYTSIGNVKNDYKRLEFAQDLVRSAEKQIGSNMSETEFRSYLDDYAMLTAHKHYSKQQDTLAITGDDPKKRFTKVHPVGKADRDVSEAFGDEALFGDTERQAQAEFTQSMVSYAEQKFPDVFKGTMENPNYVYEPNKLKRWLADTDNTAHFHAAYKSGVGLFQSVGEAITSKLKSDLHRAMEETRKERARANSLENLREQGGASSLTNVPNDFSDFTDAPLLLEDARVNTGDRETSLAVVPRSTRETIRL